MLVEARQLGGAYARQPAIPDCTTGRSAACNLYVSARASADDLALGRSIADTTLASLTVSPRAQLNFAGPAPAPGEVLQIWSPSDAERVLAVQRTLDPDNRISTGRPLR